jgi:hypothetical protein
MLTIGVQCKVPKNHSPRIVLCRAEEQIIHIPFDIAPPIRAQRPSTFCEVYLLVGIAIVELEKPVSSYKLIALRLVTHIKLLRYNAFIAMEGCTSKHRSRLLHQLHGIHCGIVPVMIVADDLDTIEPIIVQKSSKCYPDRGLL